MVSDSKQPSLRWYEGITGYQWLVLTIASLGWIFDIFEGQYFVASMRDAMPALLGVLPDDPLVSNWNDRAFGSFLLGGAFGGVLFGMLGDKIGRSKTMIIRITKNAPDPNRAQNAYASMLSSLAQHIIIPCNPANANNFNPQFPR